MFDTRCCRCAAAIHCRYSLRSPIYCSSGFQKSTRCRYRVRATTCRAGIPPPSPPVSSSSSPRMIWICQMSTKRRLALDTPHPRPSNSFQCSVPLNPESPAPEFLLQHSLNSAYSDGSSQILWEESERVFHRGWQLDDDGKRRAVLLVAPAADHPSRSTLDRLAHEYELKDELDGTWAVRPLELVREANRTMLVLEDAGGEPLERLPGVPMEAGRFLHLAIAISLSLGKLHQRGLVHKDIKPANILLNQTTGEVRLTGFGIASRFARERQSPHPPETIAGTLAYMAPEQTGRMNRSIDSRSDLYALGVTFYQMLTGVLPFAAE